MRTFTDEIKVNPEHMSEQVDKDKKRHEWLLGQIDFWEREDEKENEKKRILNEQNNEDKKTRFIELKANISETHKEPLEEIICIMKTTSISIRFLEGIDKNPFGKNREQEWNKENDEKYRIEKVETDRKRVGEKKIELNYIRNI